MVQSLSKSLAIAAAILSRAFLVSSADADATTTSTTTTSTTATEDRPPSLFKAGDEWLALPEVYSNLDFTADSTPAAEDDLEGQKTLRDSRFWGRLYIDGWPQPIQYFRAHFGSTPPVGRKRFIFAEPRDACEPMTNGAHITSEHVIIAHRGKCTFGSKAKNAFNTASSGLVIINNEPGLEHLPGPDAHDIPFSIVSISQQEGALLESYYDDGAKDAASGFGREVYGYVVPVNCENNGARCIPATYEERRYISDLHDGGVISMTHVKSKPLPESDLPLEYLLAHFGTKVAPASAQLDVIVARPAEACGPIENDVKGKAVLVRRGACPFVKKAESVQAAGGVAVVIGSTDPYVVRMGVEPRWKGLNTAIPVAMVSKRAYNILVAESYSGTQLSFIERSDVNASAWDTLVQLSNGQGWPRSATYVDKKYEELKADATYIGYPDRLAALDDAYIKMRASIGAPTASPTSTSGIKTLNLKKGAAATDL